MRHGILRRRRSFFKLIALSTASLAAQALTVLVMFQFVHLMESGEGIPYVDLDVDWARSHQGLIAFVVIVGILLALNHLTLFRLRMMAIDWSRDTEKYCGRLALTLGRFLPDLSHSSATESATDAGLQRLLVTDARSCGMTARLMVLCIPKLVALLGSVIALLVVDWAITCMVVALGAVIFLFQYPANLKGAIATRRWRASRPDAIRQIRAAIERMRLGALQTDMQDGTGGDLYEQPAVATSIRTFANRLEAIELGTLAIQIGATFVIMAVILFIGDRVLSGEAGWAFLVSYIALLRVASGGVSSLARYTTMMARLYPEVQDFVTFVQVASKASRPKPLQGPRWGLQITAAQSTDSRQGAHAKRLTVDRDQLVAVVTHDARATARPDFAIALAAHVCAVPRLAAAAPVVGGPQKPDRSRNGAGTGGAVVLVACGRIDPARPLRDTLLLPVNASDDDWQATLDALRRVRPDLGDDIEACRSLDVSPGTADAATASRPELVAQIATAILRRASIVIVERAALQALDCHGAEDPLVALLRRERLVAILYQHDEILRDAAPDFGEQVALVCAGTSLRAAMDLTENGAVERLKIGAASALGQAGKSPGLAETKADEDLADVE